MLIWCFGQKLIYLQRLLPPSKLKSLITVFQNCKKEILEDLVDGVLDDRTFALSLLPIKDSGLGLSDSTQISHSAFVASKAEFYAENIDLFEEAENSDMMCLNNILTSVNFIQQFKADFNFHALLKTINENPKSDKNTQNLLTDIYKNANRNSVIESFNCKEKVLLNSFKDDDCGRFLTMAPKSNIHSLQNQYMMSALRFRLIMSQPKFINDLPCRCTRSRKYSIDNLGVHVSTGCNLYGFRKANHDSIRDFIQTICNYGGYHTKREQLGIFIGNEDNIGDNSRPDLTVSNIGPRPLLLDFRLTSSLPSNGGRIPARAENNIDYADINLQLNFNSKMAHYGNAANNLNYDFLPCIIDVGGRMHSKFKELLSKVLKQAAESKNIPFGIVWNYWISGLMFKIYEGRAKSMVAFSSKVFKSGSDNVETSDSLISRSSYIN